MKRYSQVGYSIYAIALYIVLMILLSPVFLIVFILPQPNRANFIYSICKLWSSAWMILTGIIYKIKRLETQKGKSPRIFIANHRSYLDIVTLVRVLDRPTRVLGRHDICDLPVIGYFYKQAVIPVNRDSLTGRIESLLTVNRVLNKGLSVFIFPEGTFNESEHLLSSFHDGAFKLAIHTGTPIQPILFLDNYKRLNPAGTWNLSPGLSRICVLKEVDVDGYTSKDVRLLKDLVWDQMLTELKRQETNI